MQLLCLSSCKDNECSGTLEHFVLLFLQDNLVKIGTLDCERRGGFCKDIGYSDDLVFFKEEVGPNKGEVSLIVYMPLVVLTN